MDTIIKKYETTNGHVEGICVKWEGFSILLVAGPKGFIACPAIDVDACQGFGKAAAIVESSADNPIGTVDRLCERKITKANTHAQNLGIQKGMIAKDVFPLIA